METREKTKKYWKRLLVETNPDLRDAIRLLEGIILRGEHPEVSWVASEDPSIVDVLEQYNAPFHHLAERCVFRGLVDGEAWIGLNLFGGLHERMRLLEKDWLEIDFDPEAPKDSQGRKVTRGWLYEGHHFPSGDVVRMDFNPSLVDPLLQGWEGRDGMLRKVGVPSVFLEVGAPSDTVLESEYPEVWSLVVRFRETLCEGLHRICRRHFEQTGIQVTKDMFQIRVPKR